MDIDIDIDRGIDIDMRYRYRYRYRYRHRYRHRHRHGQDPTSFDSPSSPGYADVHFETEKPDGSSKFERPGVVKPREDQALELLSKWWAPRI